MGGGRGIRREGGEGFGPAGIRAYVRKLHAEGRGAGGEVPRGSAPYTAQTFFTSLTLPSVPLRALFLRPHGHRNRHGTKGAWVCVCMGEGGLVLCCVCERGEGAKHDEGQNQQANGKAGETRNKVAEGVG